MITNSKGKKHSLNVIEKKTWPEYFQKIVDGTKTFDLRLNDFECKPGDILWLREWDPQTKSYTGREIKKEISYVLETKSLSAWKDDDIRSLGYLVMSIK